MKVYIIVGYDSWNGDEPPEAIEAHLDEEVALDRLARFRRAAEEDSDTLDSGEKVDFYPAYCMLTAMVQDVTRPGPS
jgi:hypothetical protein